MVVGSFACAWPAVGRHSVRAAAYPDLLCALAFSCPPELSPVSIWSWTSSSMTGGRVRGPILFRLHRGPSALHQPPAPQFLMWTEAPDAISVLSSELGARRHLKPPRHTNWTPTTSYLVLQACPPLEAPRQIPLQPFASRTRLRGPATSRRVERRSVALTNADARWLLPHHGHEDGALRVRQRLVAGTAGRARDHVGGGHWHSALFQGVFDVLSILPLVSSAFHQIGLAAGGLFFSAPPRRMSHLCRSIPELEGMPGWRWPFFWMEQVVGVQPGTGRRRHVELCTVVHKRSQVGQELSSAEQSNLQFLLAKDLRRCYMFFWELQSIPKLQPCRPMAAYEST